MASKQAITHVQAVAVILIVFIATITGIWWYTQSVTETNQTPFSMEVISRPFTPMKGEEEAIIAMVGQKVVFLVVVENIGEGNGTEKAVEVSATVSGAKVSVENPSIKPGEVAEVTVIPDQNSTNKILVLTINGHRGGFKQTKNIKVEVKEGNDDLGEVATEMRDKFVPWLASNHPEFGITNETEWVGTIVNPGILVVMHYMFYSEDWEMYLTWHVMIPPYDWTRIYLRPRFIEKQSTIAFEISSVQGNVDPQSIELPDWV